MRNLFFAVANAYFDKDKDGRLNEAEMHEMEKVYALRTLSSDEHWKLPEQTREIVEELRMAHILDVNVKRQEERGARLMAELSSSRPVSLPASATLPRASLHR